jgi:hypothetical protein
MSQKRYKTKIKGYVVPYFYHEGQLMVMITVEKLHKYGEYYCTILGGTVKNLRYILQNIVRELCEETRGYMQIETDDLVDYLHFNDRDNCSIYLLPLTNDHNIVLDINNFANGKQVKPECAESSFIIAVSLEELERWIETSHGYNESSEPYHYFKKAYVNKWPSAHYIKFFSQLKTDDPPKIWLGERLTYFTHTALNDLDELWNIHKKHAIHYEHQDKGLCGCLC